MGLTASPITAHAAMTCAVSAGATLCLDSPVGPVRGEQTIAATWSGALSATLEFYLDGAYLDFEYDKPYSFIWPTAKNLDGSHTLSARVHQGSVYGSYVTTTVVLANGNATGIPRSPADFTNLFNPQPGATIAAVGNGGAKKPDEVKLIDSIAATSPAAFLYLGEIHEYGSWASRRDHYGLASFDDPLGVGTLYGQMAGYTLPTAGNHESAYITEFQDYWHQRPLWSTTVVDGVRIYDLTSECKTHGGCLDNGAQATWLQGQLATNNERCILSFWHRPLVSMDSKRSGTTMSQVWPLLANAGGDLVLNADTRDMQEIAPLNAALQPNQPDSKMVELISGAAAARWVTSTPNNDARVAWRLYKVPGAVYVTHQRNRLTWDFRDSSGASLRTGSVTC